MSLLSLLIGVGVCLSLALLSLVSVRERERRAARVALGLAMVLPAPWVAVSLLRSPLQPIAAAALVVGTALALLVLLLPIGRPPAVETGPPRPVDERDIMFARWCLVPGSSEYGEYYAWHPERKAIDDRIRSAPGLMGATARYHHSLAFPAAEASFSVIETMRGAVDGPVAAEVIPVDPVSMTRFIKGLARHYGAWSVGITPLRDYHVYTHVGRGEGAYGAPIELRHSYAIAITVEMSYAMVRRSPTAPSLMETSSQYLSAATVALQLAILVRSLGYPARAHIDGNYRVICPLVARDAGLGEIGRMGLLMTPQLGPRVRISVVTTDLPLVADAPGYDPAVIDFCRRCKKCAENCPSHSIPMGDRQVIDGVQRWRIDSETCFLYWNMVGTDCGRCLAVCPYSHPHNSLHNLVRWATRRSTPARWLALQLDDLFYGRKPAPLEWPEWMPNH